MNKVMIMMLVIMSACLYVGIYLCVCDLSQKLHNDIINIHVSTHTCHLDELPLQ